MSIRILPDYLINRIAAGEVIEDALSALKELVENSIDARCSRIEIELIGGGHQLIRVSDDGCGMSPDDAVLCFERHATSKIRTPDDLLTIGTMGFRGEALAAIAAVGKVELKTAEKNRPGMLVEVHATKMIRAIPIHREPGTTIEVRDLFFCTPARRKFQETSRASRLKIEKWLARFALGYPHVRISLSEGEDHITFQDAITKVFGMHFSLENYPVHFCSEGISIDGLFGGWMMHRPQRNGQVIFINGRLVEAKVLSETVRQAYATRLPQGRHPIFLLFLRLPHALLDVNAHPQKKEVRFCQEEAILKIVYQSVHQALIQRRDPLVQQSPDISYGQIETKYWNPTPQPQDHPNSSLPLLPLEYKAPQILTLICHYILLDSLEIIDLRRALERIWYEKWDTHHKFDLHTVHKREFSMPEAEEIYRTLLQCQITAISPSGEPIIAKLEEGDIAACMNREFRTV
jgi:DNA mismatch repair protein MutL